MYVPINPLGYSCIKKLQRDNLWHAYNEPINIYSALLAGVFAIGITQTKSAKRSSTGASVSAVSASVAHSGDFQAKTSD